MKKSDWTWIERDDLDLDKFDDAVQNNQRSIYAFSFYLEAVAKNWGSYVKGDYQDVFPLAYTKYLGLLQAYVPNFQGVSFFTKDEAETSVFVELLKQDWKFYELHIIQQEGISNGRAYQEIDLHDELNYSTNAKRLIKKAQKEGLEVGLSGAWRPVLDIFKAHTFEKIEGLQQSDLSYLENLLHALAENKQLQCYHILKSGQVVGGGFFIPSGERLIYLKGAALPEIMKVGGMYLLMDEAIKANKDQFEVFDFGGSVVPQVAEFNRKLGGQNRKTVSLQSKPLPIWYRWAKKLYRTIKK